jgi:hypothetical protein
LPFALTSNAAKVDMTAMQMGEDSGPNCIVPTVEDRQLEGKKILDGYNCLL